MVGGTHLEKKGAEEGKNNELFIKLLNLSMKHEKTLRHCIFSTGLPGTSLPRDGAF